MFKSNNIYFVFWAIQCTLHEPHRLFRTKVNKKLASIWKDWVVRVHFDINISMNFDARKLIEFWVIWYCKKELKILYCLVLLHVKFVILLLDIKRITYSQTNASRIKSNRIPTNITTLNHKQNYRHKGFT